MCVTLSVQKQQENATFRNARSVTSENQPVVDASMHSRYRDADATANPSASRTRDRPSQSRDSGRRKSRSEARSGSQEIARKVGLSPNSSSLSMKVVRLSYKSRESKMSGVAAEKIKQIELKKRPRESATDRIS